MAVRTDTAESLALGSNLTFHLPGVCLEISDLNFQSRRVLVYAMGEIMLTSLKIITELESSYYEGAKSMRIPSPSNFLHLLWFKLIIQ